MSKFKKLLRQPGQFVLDSKVYRRYALGRNQALRLGGPISTLAVGSAENRSSLQRRVLEGLGRAVPALDVTDSGPPRIAVLREHLPYLTEFLYDLCHRAGLKVSIRAGKHVLAVSDAKLFTLDDFLCTAKHFQAALSLPTGVARIGISFELWSSEAEEVVGPRANTVARRIAKRTVAAHGFFKRGPLRHVGELLSHPLPTAVDFPVDVVYTWVNHRDPHWRALWEKTVGRPLESDAPDSQALDRYMNRDELKFSLRSVSEHAPWVRRIFVVTNCAPPDWLDVDNPKIVWIDHAKIIPPQFLPTFSSHAIESRLHHVPDLANHFLYFNDDFFLMRPTLPSEFFEASGVSKAFVEEYGSVNGEVDPADPDYLNAARNGRRLLEEGFRRSATALHRHTPYALRKDVLLEMEERFRGPISRTTANRFRTPQDISTVSFLYHHYAYLTGRAAYAPSDSALVKPQAIGYVGKLVDLLEGLKVPISLCLNDGGGSLGFPHWDRHVVEFLEGCFPEPCELERPQEKKAATKPSA